MPPEPKKPIEELLEASARARRDQFGADPQLPNPMRVRLHEEISRLHRNAEPKERRNWFANFWPRISLAAGVAAALALAAVVWYRAEEKPGQLAVHTRADAPNESLRSPEATQTDRLAKNDEPISIERDRASESQAAGGNFADSVSVAPAIAKAAPAAPAARSFAQTRPAQTDNIPQRFSQNLDAKTVAAQVENKLKRRAALLNTFDVQQEGDRIRVVDEDGSTYTGKLEQILQTDARSLSQKKELNAAPHSSTAMKPGEQAEPNEFFFRASGINASLKKRVVFEANYIAAPVENQSKENAKDPRRDESNEARIVGRAVIPGEAPVDVDAVSVAR